MVSTCGAATKPSAIATARNTRASFTIGKTLANTYKYQQPGSTEPDPIPAAERRRIRITKVAGGIADRWWAGPGRQVMTLSTTMTVMLASTAGLNIILEQATMAGWIFGVIAFGNLIGTIGVATLSWRLFGWKYRSERDENNKRV